MKTLFVVLASIAILIAAIIFIFVAKDFILILASVILVILAFYGLWSPPKKHKDYSLSDQQRATSRALGGGGVTDLLDVGTEKGKDSIKREK